MLDAFESLVGNRRVTQDEIFEACELPDDGGMLIPQFCAIGVERLDVG